MSETIQIEHRERAEEEFRRLRDVLPQYMCAYEADGTPLYANDSLLDYFGFTLDDFRAEDFQTRAFHPDDVDRVRSVHKNAMGRGEGWASMHELWRSHQVLRGVAMRLPRRFAFVIRSSNPNPVYAGRFCRRACA